MKIFIKILLQSGLMFSILFTAVFCKKDNPDSVSFVDQGYFPDNIGHWVIYDVEEITIDKPSGKYDTIRYFLKEIIESSFLDNEGRLTMRIERYKKSNDTLLWEIKDVWTVNLLTNSAQKVEENIRYVKLIFPVELYRKWNGNAYNTLEKQEYIITSLDTAEIINSVSFDSTLTVTQKDHETLIDKFYKVEKYAKNAGLVYKKEIEIYSDELTGEPIEQRIKYGTIYTQKVIQYGNNQ